MRRRSYFGADVLVALIVAVIVAAVIVWLLSAVVGHFIAALIALAAFLLIVFGL